jgi:hypothetical protein
MSVQVVNEKFSFNPKRLVTFNRRLLNTHKAQLQLARMNGESDYELWLLQRIEKGEMVLEKKIKNISK